MNTEEQLRKELEMTDEEESICEDIESEITRSDGRERDTGPTSRTEWEESGRIEKVERDGKRTERNKLRPVPRIVKP
jgi:hypothetical protein